MLDLSFYKILHLNDFMKMYGYKYMYFFILFFLYINSLIFLFINFFVLLFRNSLEMDKNKHNKTNTRPLKVIVGVTGFQFFFMNSELIFKIKINVIKLNLDVSVSIFEILNIFFIIFKLF